MLTRAVRSLVLSLKEREFVEAARLLDLGTPRVIFVEILPNMASFILMNFMIAVTNAIYALVGLYLLGLAPLTGSNWGIMLNRAWIAGAIFNEDEPGVHPEPDRGDRPPAARIGDDDEIARRNPQPASPGPVSMVTCTSSGATRAVRGGQGKPLLSIRDFKVEYRTGAGATVHAVRGVDLDLYPGESLALVGESGCGKTTFGLGLLRLLPRLGHASGTVTFNRGDGAEIDILGLDGRDLRQFRWRDAAMVFQGAMNAFNPLLKIRGHMHDTMRAHTKASRQEIEDRAGELLRLVRLEPARVMDSYPHELSGGMRQRVLIAMSLLLEPEVLILDEPTTALDILTQRSIVDVLHEVRERLGFSMIFISHDLSLAAELADRVATMYAGRIVETGGVRDLFYQPRHPYTLALINAVPPIVGDLPDLESIPGGPPSLAALPRGCTFHPRCKFATEECKAADPPLLPVTDQPATGTRSPASIPAKCTSIDGCSDDLGTRRHDRRRRRPRSATAEGRKPLMTLAAVSQVFDTKARPDPRGRRRRPVA